MTNNKLKHMKINLTKVKAIVSLVSKYSNRKVRTKFGFSSINEAWAFYDRCTGMRKYYYVGIEIL